MSPEWIMILVVITGDVGAAATHTDHIVNFANQQLCEDAAAKVAQAWKTEVKAICVQRK